MHADYPGVIFMHTGQKIRPKTVNFIGGRLHT